MSGWLTCSILIYMDSACQADSQSSSVSISGGAYTIHNFWLKYDCSACTIIEIPPSYNS